MSIRNGLLALLLEGRAYGNQLRTDFEERTGGTWPLNIGQVYQTLDRLVRDGLVVAEDVRSADIPVQARSLYRITDAGQAEVLRWFAEPVARGPAPRDELAIKLAVAMCSPRADVVPDHRRPARLHDGCPAGADRGQAAAARGGPDPGCASPGC